MSGWRLHMPHHGRRDRRASPALPDWRLGLGPPMLGSAPLRVLSGIRSPVRGRPFNPLRGITPGAPFGGGTARLLRSGLVAGQSSPGEAAAAGADPSRDAGAFHLPL